MCSSTRARDAVESISEGFILYDADERFVLCNSKYRDFYPSIANILMPGAKLEDVTRVSFERGDIRGLAENVEAWMERRRTQYHTGRGTHEQHLKDGRWVLCSEGRTSTGGTVGIRTDITESKRAEEALRESEERLRGILNMAMDAVISIDEDHRIQLFSRGAEAIFGYAAGLSPGSEAPTARAPLLRKPYDPSELARVIARALDG